VAPALLLAATACAPRVTVSGALRGDLTAAPAAPTQQALRGDLRALSSLPVGRGRLDGEAVPTLVLPLDGTTAQRAFVRGRVAYVPDPRARLQPAATLRAERGTTRPSEVVPEALDPRPSLTELRAERYVLDGSLRARVGARGGVLVSGLVERGGGLGAAAATLPQTLRVEQGIAAEVPGPGSSTLSLFARQGRTTVGTAAPWEALSGGLRLRVSMGPGRILQVDGGAVRGRTGDEAAQRLYPSAALRFSQSARGPRPGLTAALERIVEPDRLDGLVRERYRAALAFETPAVSTVSFRGTLQGLADAGSPAPRRAVGVDALLRVRFREDRTMEYGVAHLVQDLGAGATRGETRLTVGLRATLLGGPCRNSC
jgi:hypothetical protein